MSCSTAEKSFHATGALHAGRRYGVARRLPGRELARFQTDRSRLVRTAKAVQALPDVGREADLALFPIIDDRQPYLSLALDLLYHSASDRGVQDLGVDRLALLSSQEHLQQLWGTCQTPGVRRQDTFSAALHRSRPSH